MRALGGPASLSAPRRAITAARATPPRATAAWAGCARWQSTAERTAAEGVTMVSNLGDAQRVLDILAKLPPTTLHAWDTEVANIDVKTESPVGHGTVICASFYSGPNIDYGSGPKVWIDNLDAAEGVLLAFKDVLQSRSVLKVWHNYGFDRHVLYNHGIDAHGLGGDTMHMARLWNTDLKRRGGYSLENLADMLVGMTKTPMKQLFGRSKPNKDGAPGKLKVLPPLEEVQRSPECRDAWVGYSTLDAACTWHLREALEAKLRGKPWVSGQSLWDFYGQFFVPFAEVLTDLERAGIFVDVKDHLPAAERAALQERARAETMFMEWASQFCPDAKHMNIGSDAQKAHLLFAPCSRLRPSRASLAATAVVTARKAATVAAATAASLAASSALALPSLGTEGQPASTSARRRLVNPSPPSPAGAAPPPPPSLPLVRGALPTASISFERDLDPAVRVAAAPSDGVPDPPPASKRGRPRKKDNSSGTGAPLPSGSSPAAPPVPTAAPLPPPPSGVCLADPSPPSHPRATAVHVSATPLAPPAAPTLQSPPTPAGAPSAVAMVPPLWGTPPSRSFFSFGSAQLARWSAAPAAAASAVAGGARSSAPAPSPAYGRGVSGGDSSDSDGLRAAALSDSEDSSDDALFYELDDPEEGGSGEEYTPLPRGGKGMRRGAPVAAAPSPAEAAAAALPGTRDCVAWPASRVFKIDNTEGIVEPGAKAAKKQREITLIGVGLPPVARTVAGWPAVSAPVLKLLAGKVGGSGEPVYGRAYDYFGGGEEGATACKALHALYTVSTIDTMLSNFIVPLQTMADAQSRVHCSLNLNTETGRLSARRPNLQNQPALEKDRYGIRKAFRARAGCKLIAADYGQLELRLLAHMARCKSMLDAFRAGGDFHSRTAAGMYPHIQAGIDSGSVLLEWDDAKAGGTPATAPLLKTVYANERRKAKVLNFSIAYGKTALGLSKDWGVSLEEAKDTLEKWYADRPEVREWQQAVLASARTSKATRTLLGRYRDLPDIDSRDIWARRHAERAAINTPIQGGAADVAMMAMLKLWRNEALGGLGWRMLLQVHDEVVLEGPEETAQEALRLVVADMEAPFAAPLLVDLVVDAKVVDTWYDAK